MKSILLATIVCACGPLPEAPIDTPENERDFCSAACDKLAELQCPGWRGSPGLDEIFGTDDDISCSRVCNELVVESSVTLHAECTSEATSCAAVERCFDGTL
jgi:hypothetical protein